MTGSPSSRARCAVRCSIASSGSTLQRRSSIVCLVVPQMLTAERGAYRPPRIDVYYWMDYPIWEQRRYMSENAPGEYSFRYAVVAIILAVAGITC